jgi:hypothetical protein
VDPILDTVDKIGLVAGLAGAGLLVLVLLMTTISSIKEDGFLTTAAILVWPVAFLLVLGGLLAVGVGVFQLVTADEPIKCGDEVMPNDDRYWCLGGGPSTYEAKAENKREGVEQAPYVIAIGASAVLVSVLGMVGSRRYLKSRP